ncbi:porin family protein [Muricauda sp. 334s03]|uniref:Porin family protein n=1 Tax=Flagellimonas yonaguniensis TaxID=3031325 RepID=A0ABT5Y0B5_9FLAO|nr:porin family protein [[Muricauda] yonaguniensis]MDF0716803.1 porin family protein [[Muricauda] yonaguniensis]
MIRTVLFTISALLLLIPIAVLGQEEEDGLTVTDNRYLEDQFYIGVGYNVLFDGPDAIDQRNLSYNLQAGFIKDIPFNRQRNFGMGLGLGYAVNSYYSNMVATLDNNGITYDILDDADFNRSKLATHTIEIPFEIRWRTSTASEYKFWRVYAGAKVGYVFSGRSKLVVDSGNDSFSNNDIEKFQYGLMLNFGYNTWNIHVYYGLNPLLKDEAMLAGEAIDLKVLRVGLVFYIL